MLMGGLWHGTNWTLWYGGGPLTAFCLAVENTFKIKEKPIHIEPFPHPSKAHLCPRHAHLFLVNIMGIL